MKEFDRSRFYTLLAVAYGVAKDLQENNTRVHYYLHLALEGYREFSFDYSAELKAVEIPLKSWKQIDFPCDMVDWVRVAFKCGDLLKVLTQDTYIPKTFDKVNCVPQENKPINMAHPIAAGDIPFYVWERNDVALYYGQNIGYNYLGYFDVDWKQRVINFKELVTGYEKVYLEYISDGLEATGMTVVNPYAYWCLKQWVKWQRKENDDRYSVGEKKAAKQEYKESLTDYQERITHMDVDDVKEAIREGFTQVVQN